MPGLSCLRSAEPQGRCHGAGLYSWGANCLSAPVQGPTHEALPFALSRLQPSFLIHAPRPCPLASIICKNLKMAYFRQGRLLGMAVLKQEGQRCPAQPKLPGPRLWPALLPSCSRTAQEAWLRLKERAAISDSAGPLISNVTPRWQYYPADKNLYQAQTYGWLQNTEPDGAG